MKYMQVKYCYSEEELNKFLKTFTIDTEGLRPHTNLHSIQYCAAVEGKGNNDSAEVGSSVVAIVQYYIEKKSK